MIADFVVGEGGCSSGSLMIAYELRYTLRQPAPRPDFPPTPAESLSRSITAHIIAAAPSLDRYHPPRARKNRPNRPQEELPSIEADSRAVNHNASSSSLPMFADSSCE